MEKPNQENYYDKQSDYDYMSYSQFCKFMKCEAEALAEVRREYEEEMTKPMLVGSYVDAHFSGEMDEFTKKHPEIFKKDGTLLSDFVGASKIIKTIEEDPFMLSFYQGDKQVIEVGQIAGIPFKIKMDSLYPDKIVDQKVMKDFDDIWTDAEGRVPFWKAYGYDIQAAIYQEIHAQNSGEKLPFYLVAASKQDSPDKRIIQFSQQTLDNALNLVRGMAERFDSIKKGKIDPKSCGKCDYCRMKKKMSEKDIVII